MEYTTKYKTIREEKSSLHSFARDLALNGLSLTNHLRKQEGLRIKPRVQFLFVHHVFDDEYEKFDLLLNRLSKTYIFISHTEAINKILNNQIDKPYLAFSSDDGFKNNIKAAEILKKYDIKACFFINPDTIGLGDYQDIKTFCRSRLNFPPTQFMNWDDIDNLMSDGHEIGSHTMGHINVGETSYSLVEDNLQNSFDILLSRCGKAEHFAYPYGRYFHFNLASFKLVFDIGYKSCASAERGCHVTDKEIIQDQLLIRRDHIVCDWNFNHIDYFLLNNSKKAAIKNNFTPYI